jgi:hypothetical protein
VDLKLVSFQKNSFSKPDYKYECTCSRVAHPSFIQLTPDRYAYFLFDKQNDKMITVTVSGFTDEEKVKDGKIEIKAAIEVETEEGNSIPWKTVDTVDDPIKLDLKLNTNELIWTKVITLPYKTDKCRLRL